MHKSRWASVTPGQPGPHSFRLDCPTHPPHPPQPRPLCVYSSSDNGTTLRSSGLWKATILLIHIGSRVCKWPLNNPWSPWNPRHRGGDESGWRPGPASKMFLFLTVCLGIPAQNNSLGTNLSIGKKSSLRLLILSPSNHGWLRGQRSPKG